MPYASGLLYATCQYVKRQPTHRDDAKWQIIYTDGKTKSVPDEGICNGLMVPDFKVLGGTTVYVFDDEKRWLSAPDMFCNREYLAFVVSLNDTTFKSLDFGR